MSINAFYTDVLGADLRNPRWSWGSVDPVTNRVFLRVWDDEVRYLDGNEHVLILRPSSRPQSPGYAERESHISMIAQGAQGYGVVCTAREPLTDGPRQIIAFDSNTLLEFGDIVELGDGTYARVERRVRVQELQRKQTSGTTLARDLKAILRQAVGPTEREVLLSARIGQGQFRTQVLRRWGGECAVTGTGLLDVIRASHVKPWRASTGAERLDPWNGIPLIATYDALFDAGLITFDEDGAIRASPRLSDGDRLILGIGDVGLRRRPAPQTCAYLQYHHEHVFR